LQGLLQTRINSGLAGMVSSKSVADILDEELAERRA
jgi:type IV secretory pathway VirB10-like protein